MKPYNPRVKIDNPERGKRHARLSFRVGAVDVAVEVQWLRRRHNAWAISIEVSDPNNVDDYDQPVWVALVSECVDAHDIEDAQRIAYLYLARFASEFRLGIDRAEWK